MTNLAQATIFNGNPKRNMLGILKTKQDTPQIPQIEFILSGKYNNDISTKKRQPYYSTKPYRVSEFESYIVEDEKTINSDVRNRFEKYLKQWKDETKHLSSVSEIIYNVSYQKIIGLGQPVVPLLLEKMNEEPDFFFWALYCITDENPVHPDHNGLLIEMTIDWIEWGKKRGFL